MKQIMTIRQRVVDGFSREIDKICVYVSGIDGNRNSVELLKGKSKVELIADLTEVTMQHMGRMNGVTRWDDGGNEKRNASMSVRTARGEFGR